LELRHLEYFIVVAEELHFGKAAVRLNMTQPPLSQQILLLEKELGVKLLERSKRHVELTNAGKAFLGEVRRVFEQLERAQAAAKRAEMGMIGKLVLGFVGSAMFDILPMVVRAFQEQFSRVELILREMPTPMQIEAFHRNEIDVGFIRTPVVDPLLSLRSVHQESCIAVVSKMHPLSARDSITMDNLKNDPFIVIERDVFPSWYDDILTKCRVAGFSPIIRQEVKEIQSIIGLVAAGLGVSIVPRSTANLHARDVVYLNIEGGAPQAEMSIAWRTDDKSPVLKHFLETAARLFD